MPSPGLNGCISALNRDALSSFLKVFTTLDPTIQKNLLALFAAGLLFWTSLASLLPVLPLYIAEVSRDAQILGLVMGCFAIGLLASRPFFAKLADFRGRKIVLMMGMAAVAIAPLGYILTDSIPLLMLVRAFHGLSIAAFALGYSALVVDLSPPQNRGELIGYMSLVNPLGMGIGPALGGFLQEAFGYHLMFWVSALIGFVGLLLTWRVQEPQQAAIALEQQPAPKHFWRMLLQPHIRIPALVLLMIGLSFGALSTFVPLLVREAGVTLNVGLFYSAAAIASFTIRLVVGRASDRFGRGPFISISLLFYTAAMVLLWRATSAATFLVAGVLEGAGAGVLIPMMAALMADRSQANERGRTFSLCMVGFDLGIAFAGPVLGAVATQTSYRAVFGISAGLSLLGFLFFLMLSGKTLQQSLRFALGQGRDVYAVDRSLRRSPVP